MIKTLFLLIFLFTFSCTAKLPLQDKKPVNQPQIIEHEVLVKFQEGVSQEESNKIISSCGGTVIKHLEGINVYHIKVTSSSAQGISCFQKNASIKYAEPNRVVKIYK